MYFSIAIICNPLIWMSAYKCLYKFIQKRNIKKEKNVTTNYRIKMCRSKGVENLLVYGFIRRNEKPVIPQEILTICLNYYRLSYHSLSKRLYAFKPFYSTNKYQRYKFLYSLRMDGTDQIQYNIYSLNNPNIQTASYPSVNFATQIKNNEIAVTGYNCFCCQRNMLLPTKMDKQMVNALKHHNIKVHEKTSYDVIFKVCGGCFDCNCYFGIIVLHRMYDDNKEMIGFQHNLNTLTSVECDRASLLFVDDPD